MTNVFVEETKRKSEYIVVIFLYQFVLLYFDYSGKGGVTDKHPRRENYFS